MLEESPNANGGRPKSPPLSSRGFVERHRTHSALADKVLSRYRDALKAPHADAPSWSDAPAARELHE